MSCLIDFLTDEKQKSLINMVQNREETFEKELESYERLFMVELEHYINREHADSLESAGAKYNRRDFCQDDNCYFADACSNIYTVLCSIPKNRIKHFFQGIKYCYTCWIDSQTTIALEAFDSLLKEYKLISNESYDEQDELLINNISGRVFFRGRITSQFLGKMDMFHVPYNKRYNLRNERFSLTGQPMLYLGNSIADIVEELEINDEDATKCLKISSFEFLDDRFKARKFKIFDLRCNIWHDMKNIRTCTFSEKKFFRNILSAICSFQQRKELEGYVFKEEYVIPQILAQVLKQNHYDGICYYSTKRFQKYRLNEVSQKVVESEINMRYRENIAIFTKIIRDDESRFYDKDLWTSLEISMPIAICNVKDSSEEELMRIYHSIKEHNIGACAYTNNQFDCTSQKCEQCKCRNRTYFMSQKKVDSIVNFYSSVISKLKIGDTFYTETNFGKIHLQLLIGILNRILVESEVDTIEYKEDTKEKEAEPLEIVQCCDLFGKSTVEKTAKEVHDLGELHKGQIVFIIRKLKSDSEVQIAMNKKTWTALFYGHPSHIGEQFQQLGFAAERDKKQIGAFINREISTTEWPKTGFALKIDFEYIEIFLSDMTDQDTPDNSLIWLSVNELINQFTLKYQVFSSVNQQAVPILINHLSNQSI